ncbi:DUF742 domain-containing protein [Streptomyces pseudovenezuelae]|uniref:DUF742 domain-containing protein n=1 Tax=Streptomyces pseudovenezuelae TaxID=67350 RepID=A0ABT6LKY2_9ACTN|nr:DUF742 domain-containing protein [Streptomyces pseudovenezuelae]MDH6216965.1 hypothetical protein [Streptomyces pseudovenezuelae]
MTPPKRQRRYPKEEPPLKPKEGNEGNERKEGKQGDEKAPERLYVVAGRDGERADLDLVTLIVAHSDPSPSSTPEQTTMLRLCSAPLSVAELSAYLSLPFSVVTVLLTEMLTAELVVARASIVRQALPDRSLLEAVMHGLQRL